MSPPTNVRVPKLSLARTWAVLATLGRHLWPKGETGLRCRVVVALVLLVLAKVVNVYVPILYKHAVDALGGTAAQAVAVPVALILAYGVARVLAQALGEIRRVLRPGARLHAFEGDHGSVLAWPDDPAIDRLVSAVSRHQCLQGGDPYIGRRLAAILSESGFQHVAVEPCLAYADATRPDWIDAFTKATFIDMMKAQREAVLERDLISDLEWRDGIEALGRTTASDGTFCYTFFRATADR